MNMAAQPYPQIPTTQSNITDVADSAEDVLQRINDLPIEQLMSGAIDLMDSLERLANDDSLRSAPASLTALLDDARGLITSEDVTRIPTDIRRSINELNEIIASARETDTVGRLNTAIDSVTSVADDIGAATSNLPQISAQLESLATKANDLDLDGLLVAARDTIRNIDGIVQDTAAQQLPQSVAAIVEDLAKLNGVIEAAQNTVTNIDTAAADLPAITQQLNDLATKANGLDLETLVAEATSTLDSIDLNP